MMNMVKRFISDESGATAIEYGLIAAGIGVAISVIVFTLGGTISGLFDDINTRIDAAAPV
ncbi:MAG: Flp family type IVb pilin [Pseudomonadota bacterium]